MKKSEDLSQAFLLKHFPGRSRMSTAVPSEVSWRNSVLLATSALIITLVTSVILHRQTMASLEQERSARVALEQQLESMKVEMSALGASRRAVDEKVEAFSGEITGLMAAAVKEEKVFWTKIISVMEKHDLPSMNRVAEEVPVPPQANPEIVQGLAPWEKAE